MLGILVELIFSWLLLWFVYRKNLSVLGIGLTKSRLNDLFFGFLITAVCGAIYFSSFAAFGNNNWTLNEGFTIKAFAAGSWWTMISVLYEELIFRGALLYIAIKRFGITTSCVASAISFGVYHWFSMGVLGNPMQMIFIFCLTGVWGFMFAMAFAKTRSLYLPIGLHSGWNLISTVVFSQGPLGNQLLVNTGEESVGGMFSMLFFVFQLFAMPLITLWYLKWQQQNNFRFAEKNDN